MKKAAIIGSVVLLVGVGLVGALLFTPTFTPQPTQNTVADNEVNNTTETPTETEEPTDQVLAQGTYTDYSEEAVANPEYNRTVIFFYAPWCPECRAFDAEIIGSAGDIPNGTQILKLDYDSSTDLRQKYGVTLQSTFVAVDSDGNQLNKWVGYGEDKALNTILTNV